MPAPERHRSQPAPPEGASIPNPGYSLSLASESFTERPAAASQRPTAWVRSLAREGEILRRRVEETLGTPLDDKVTLVPSSDGRLWYPYPAAGVSDPIALLRRYNIETREIRSRVSAVITKNFQEIAGADQRPEIDTAPRVALLASPGALLFATRVAAWTGMRRVNYGCQWKEFPNGEAKFAAHKQNFRDANVIIIHTPYGPHQDRHMKELRQMIDLVKGHGACASVRVWMSNFPYERQDHQPRGYGSGIVESESLHEEATTLSGRGIDEIVVMDFHPSENASLYLKSVGSNRRVYGSYVLIPRLTRDLEIGSRLSNENCAVFAPDVGRQGSAEFLAHTLQLPLLFVNKIRDPETQKVSFQRVVAAKIPPVNLMIDDMIDSGGTLFGAVLDLAQAYAAQQAFTKRPRSRWTPIEIESLEWKEKLELARKISKAFPEFIAHVIASRPWLNKDAVVRINEFPLLGKVYVTDCVRNGHSPFPIQMAIPLCGEAKNAAGAPGQKIQVLDHSTLTAEVVWRWLLQIHGYPSSVSRISEMLLHPSGLPSYLAGALS